MTIQVLTSENLSTTTYNSFSPYAYGLLDKQEIQIRFLGREDPPQKEMATCSACLENPMDRGACRATAHGTAKSWTQLHSYTTTTNLMLIVEKQTTSVKLE